MKTNKRNATIILNALNSGVVPPKGIKALMVGRHLEMTQIEKDLNDVAEDVSKIKFFAGPYGSGKSFIQGLLKELALDNNFIVAQADLSPNTRLFANDGKAKQLYSTLLNNLSSPSSRNGGALKFLLDEWLSELEEEAENIDELKETIHEQLKSLTNASLNNVKGFEEALYKYAEAYLTDNEDKKERVVHWLKGEYQTKTESMQEVGINSIINDNNYYDYLKIWTYFVRLIGYKGFVVNLDEMVNLYKISHVQSRVNNYERLLTIINDVLQGSLPGLYITFSGTLELVTDERKGLYSYDALKRRLQINRYETKENRDVAQPVIQLYPLNANELLVLLMNINELYKIANEFDSQIIIEDVQYFLVKQYSYPGAEKRLTVGHLVREFINVLNILFNNPTNTDELRKEILGKQIETPSDSLEEQFQDDEDETTVKNLNTTPQVNDFSNDSLIQEKNENPILNRFKNRTIGEDNNDTSE